MASDPADARQLDTPGVSGEEILRRWTELDRAAMPWLELWQLIGEFVNQLKQDFNKNVQPGSMLNEDLFDSTAVDANTKMTAALIGMLWPSSESILLQPPKTLKETDEIKKYFEAVNVTIRAAFDDPKAGFMTTLEEYMSDQGSLGTSAIATFPGVDSDLSFEAWGVDEIRIADGKGGRTDTIFRKVCWELRRIADEFGVENLSRELQQQHRGGQLDTKYEIVHAIYPHPNPNKEMLDNKNMDIRSCTIEAASKHVIKESGYPEMPAAVCRFYKRRKEAYGRSCAMKALPDILEANVTKESRILAIEKALEPPFAMYSDSVLGNQKLDLSARAVTIIKQSGKLRGGSPIIPLYDGANIPQADKALEELQRNINNHFNLDRLLDFNNTTSMTLGEAQMRAQLRGESLGAIYSRQQMTLTEVIERSAAILFRAWKLGVIEGSIQHQLAQQAGEEVLVIPDEVVKLITTGKDFYVIKYQSPATRIMEAQEAQGVMRTWEFGASLAKAGAPEVLDVLDAEESLRIVGRNQAAPGTIFRSKQMVDAIHQQKAQQAQQQQEMAQAQQAAQVAATAAAIPQNQGDQ